jgi:hypothetical protein
MKEELLDFTEGVLDTITFRRVAKIAVITVGVLVITALFKNRSLLIKVIKGK